MEKSQVYQQKTPGFAGVTKDHALSGLVRVFENRPRLLTALLFFPGSFWMLLFVGAPLVAVFFFSFWTSGFRGLQPIYTLDNYRDVLLNATFWKITLWTFEVVAMLLVGVIILAYPASYAIWRIVKDEKWKLVILIMSIIPFWTSYLTRTITWLPMFGREGVVNGFLRAIGVTSQPLDILLYTPFAMMIALWFLYIVFMIGPIYFSMTRIEEDVMSAAAVFGAGPWRTFATVVLPLTKPGLMAGSLFVVILGLADFFTERVVGGAQNPMVAGLIVRQIDVFVWSKGAAISVVLVFLTILVAGIMLRLFDITKV